MKTWLPILALAALGSANLAPAAPVEPQLGVRADLSETTPIREARGKPTVFSNCAERLEFIHANVSPLLQSQVVRADALFRTETNRLATPPTSRFRLSFIGAASMDGDGPRFNLAPAFDADIELPNLEHRWKVYLRSRAENVLPGVDDTERSQVTRIGVSRLVRQLDIESDAGIRLRNPPVAFAQLKWEPRWTCDLWVFRPGQRVFAESGEGLGTLTSFSVYRWFGPGMNHFAQSLTAVRRTQRSDGWEGEQTLRIGRVEEILEGALSWFQLAGDRDVARGEYLRFSLFGHREDATSLDATRLGFVIRRPCYRKWVYLQVTPELQWTRDNAWRTEYILKVGLDLLFWGTEER